MEPCQYTLQEGITYHHLPSTRFKTGYFSINFILPRDRQDVAYYALLPHVLRCGSRSYPNRRAIVKRLEALYGADIYARHFGRGDKQVISFSADFLDSAYLPPHENMDLTAETLLLLKDIVFSPLRENGLFLREYVDTETRHCIETVRALINRKQQYAIRRCMTLMCADEPAGIDINGTEEDFDNIDQDKLMQCYQHMLAYAQIEIFYIGSASPSAMCAMLPHFLSGYLCQRKTIPMHCIHQHPEKTREKTETANTTQGELVLGFRTGVGAQDADQPALSLFNEIYGGSPSSKLFLNVREKKSLCYSCFSAIDSMTGIMYVNAGIDIHKRDEVVAEVLLQLEKMRQNSISDEELYYAKQSIANGYRALYDSPEGLEDWYLRRILAGQPMVPEAALARIMALQKDDVAAVARKITPDMIYFLRGEGHEDEEEEDGDGDE